MQLPQLRRLATASTTEEVRSLLQKTIASRPSDFAGVTSDGEMDIGQFQEMIHAIVPAMGKEESKALFISMDTSNDGSIQSTEIFSELTLAILLNRMSNAVQHPLDGSYQCLPRPPFHSDPKQLEAIEILKKVFDEVVVAHTKPVPVPPKPVPKKEPPSGFGMFGSMFGGKKSKAKAAKPQALVLPPPRPNAPKGAYLYGGCGCGKTVLLDLFFRSLPDGFTARRLHWHEFIRDAFRAMQGHPPGENVFEAMADRLSKEFRVLLLDELVITHISEAILVKNLFRHMWARGMTVITTSNYLPHELYAKGFNRDQFVEFIPELEAQCPTINMSGQKDYRKTDSHLDSADVFFTPIDDASTTRMDKVWEALVGKEVTQDLQLPIPSENRSVHVPLSGYDTRGGRVGKFTFEGLCVKNLGRADYSVIAENFHTVFIYGVPKFKPDLGAEFRRFVSMTDIFYGKKVALYMQSEVHTDDLYADGMKSADMDMDELWAFRRSSSMLSEVQNPKYHHMVWLMRNHMLRETALQL